MRVTAPATIINPLGDPPILILIAALLSQIVARYTGAWIETLSTPYAVFIDIVAPHGGVDRNTHANTSTARAEAMPKLGAWREQLDALLAANDGKPARERLTVLRLFETLRDLGFDGAYDAGHGCSREGSGSKARGSAVARGHCAADVLCLREAYQFD